MANEKTETSLDALTQFCQSYTVVAFRPLAYYDKHMDCIRVQMKDCSFVEDRTNRFFTVLRAHHSETQDMVGFTIKGIRYLFETLGLPKNGPVLLTQIIDAILQAYPDQTMTQVVGEIKIAFSGILGIPVDDLEVNAACA